MKKLLIFNAFILSLILVMLSYKFIFVPQIVPSPQSFTWRTLSQVVLITYADGKEVKAHFEMATKNRKLTEQDVKEAAVSLYEDRELAK